MTTIALLSVLVHPRQREGLISKKRCYEEHITNSVACGGDTRDLNRRLKLKPRGYIIQCSMILKKSVTRTNSHAEQS